MVSLYIALPFTIILFTLSPNYMHGKITTHAKNQDTKCYNKKILEYSKKLSDVNNFTSRNEILRLNQGHTGPKPLT